MHGKYQFWLHLTLVLSLIIVTTTLVSPVAANSTELYVDPPSIVDKGVDSTFTININIKDVTDLFNFDFKLWYKTSVLTATSVTVGSFLLPGYIVWAKVINDTAGYVWYAISQSEATGVSGSGTLATITFTVDDLGASSLYLVDTILYDSAQPVGHLIAHEVYDGHFVNSPVHDIALTSVTPSAPTVILGQTVNVAVVARNHGNFTESFTVTAYRNATAIGTPQTVTNLAPGGRTTLTFTWNTTGVPLGKYIILANATTVLYETDTTDNTLNKAYDYIKKIFVDVTITIIDYPIAVFNYSPMYPVVNEMVTFNASDSEPHGGEIRKYEWNFGDGFTGTFVFPVITHVYLYPGTYNVTLTVEDSEKFEGKYLTDTTWQLITIYLLKPISIYTDKPSYSAGETMYLGLDIHNPLDRPITVCIVIWLERPVGPIIPILHAHAVTLPAGFTRINPTFKSYVLPSIPPGTYTWHAATLNPTTHTVYVEDTAEWEFI